MLKKKIYCYLDFIFLKKKINNRAIFNVFLKINTFLEKKTYSFYIGRFYVFIDIKNFFSKTKFNQYLFSKKPFSGPLKKFKK